MPVPRLFIALVILTGLSSCQHDDNPVFATDGHKVALSIAEDNSRSSVDASGNIAFADGDEIVLYSQGLAYEMNGAYARVTHTSTIALDGDYAYSGDNPATFHAFYPAEASVDANTALLTVHPDQSDDGYARSYLLYSVASGTAADGCVSLTFRHAMAMVKVNIKEATDAKDVRLLHIKPQAEISLTPNGALSESIVTPGGEPCDVTMHRAQDGTFQAMVPPQVLSAETPIEVVIGEDKYTFTPESEVALTSGHICHIALTPSNDSPEFTFPENSLIPEITENTNISRTTSSAISYDYKPGIWYQNTSCASSLSPLTEGGGFQCEFKVISYKGYYLRSGVIFLSEFTLAKDKTYTLRFQVSSDTESKIGVAIYGRNGMDTFFYHATSTEGNTNLDSKESDMEFSTTSELKQIEIMIDPNYGTSEYSVGTSYKENLDGYGECLFVFYQAVKSASHIYTIKNITLTPNG